MEKGTEFIGRWRTGCKLVAVVTHVVNYRLEGYLLVPAVGPVIKVGVKVPTWWNLEGVSNNMALTLVDRVRENEKL